MLLFKFFSLYLGEIWQYSDFRSLTMLQLDVLIWEMWNMIWHYSQSCSLGNENLMWQMLQSTGKSFGLNYSSGEVALIRCPWALRRWMPWQRTLIAHLLVCSPPWAPAWSNKAQMQLNCWLLVYLISQVWVVCTSNLASLWASLSNSSALFICCDTQNLAGTLHLMLVFGSSWRQMQHQEGLWTSVMGERQPALPTGLQGERTADCLDCGHAAASESCQTKGIGELCPPEHPAWEYQHLTACLKNPAFTGAAILHLPSW